MVKPGRREFLRTAFAAAIGATAVGLSASRAIAAPVLPANINPALFERAMAAFAKHHARISERRMIGIADFSAASATPRFHLVNLEAGEVNAVLVAHGRGSDPEHSGWVQSFSNVPGSEATSSGTFVTGESYIGQHGLSRRLTGLDPENDAAEARAIVVHRADYVSQGMIAQWGKIGRSQGCFAFSDDDIDQVLWRLPQGSMIYADKV